ncbi:hypothetical protein ACFQVC_32535 [Streptomyces monticola]|uniref:Uncharacterized protein n=1 Tax=Streptomyces monticola TaxID=2666263 RepID=A0ABW2JTE9_9ACTN
MAPTKCGGDIHAYYGHTYTGTSSFAFTKAPDWLENFDQLKEGKLTALFNIIHFLANSYDITCRFYEDHDPWVDVTLKWHLPSWFPANLQDRASKAVERRPAHTCRTGFGIDTRPTLVQVSFHAETGPPTKTRVVERTPGGKVLEDSFGQTLYGTWVTQPRQTFKLEATDCAQDTVLPQRLRQVVSGPTKRIIELNRTS